MADEAELEAQAVGEGETPAEFLTNLGNSLRENEGVDVGLANILAKYLLTATPDANAVAKAKDAIVKLAGERATPQQGAGNA